MTTLITTTKPRRTPGGIEFGHGGGPGGRGDGEGGGAFARTLPLATHRLGMAFGLASVTMLFTGLTSAYVVRQGLDPGWRAIQMPTLLWINTAVLLASSLTMEMARRALKSGLGDNAAQNRPQARVYIPDAVNRWLMVTLLLGLGFLGGQFAAWRRLAAEGIYLSTNPHSSFFYMLTALHGLHLLGGILALACLVWMVWRHHGLPLAASAGSPEMWTSRSHPDRWVDGTALYWHFMDGLWIYLVVLLFGLR